ncbi:MAG: DUF2294 domain-containing protein [Vallitaleaceae bacterium]|nr:DUF2294 domain-containing protein [Vallitaleaceae bacterium]
MEKGQMEALISNSMISFQREQLGRGAESAKTYIIDDMIVIRLKGVLTSAEKQLAQKEKGKALVKEMRYQLEEIIRPKLEQLIEEITGAKVISLHNDISTKTGERMDVVILDHKLEFK